MRFRRGRRSFGRRSFSRGRRRSFGGRRRRRRGGPLRIGFRM